MSATIDRMLAEARARCCPPWSPQGKRMYRLVRGQGIVEAGKTTCYVPDPDAPCILPQHFGRNPRRFDF